MFRMYGLWFRVSDQGFGGSCGISGLGFRAYGFLGVQDLGFKGFRVQDSGFRYEQHLNRDTNDP